MLRLRYISRLIATFLSRFKGLMMTSAILGILFFVIIRFITPLVFQGSVEKVGVYGRFRSNSLPIYIQRYISSGLTKISDNHSKSLASSLPVKNIASKFPKSTDSKVQKLIDGIIPIISSLSSDGMRYYEPSGKWVAYPNNFVAIKVQDARVRV